ncbi:hypothetical protein K1T35_47455 (plasmid) [Pseudonocardia sp. DSM 110487]|uniref:hypothetical protein n=1 Tax=Pseudonocardia sp. DSM 110487 TaxID=2865833 RepID=UPI001C6A65E9|nr:hypothetical protein [Pseudonocardia sp. DSM 110487]QYN40987.1 hypothetical protein K1T35_47455 [Pseudonocardia sp. DSM 110487]
MANGKHGPCETKGCGRDAEIGVRLLNASPHADPFREFRLCTDDATRSYRNLAKSSRGSTVEMFDLDTGHARKAKS